MSNGTITFILLGLTDEPQLQVLLFIFLLLTYMLSVTENLSIISLTFVDFHLKKPMYFFLQNVSFSEVSFTSACIPRYLYRIAITDLFAVTEFYLLVAMSNDLYAAICKPLHYVTIRSRRVCRNLIICCWMAGLCVLIPPLSLGLKLEFCDSNFIDHFAYDAFLLVKIAYSDTWSIEQTAIICAVLTLNMTLTCIVVSYAYIIRTIFRFPSVQQRKKAFSTCSSHKILVSITYGMCIFIYMNPTAKEEVTISKVVSMVISSISPTLNPFLYTLINNQVKRAFRDSIKKRALFSTK